MTTIARWYKQATTKERNQLARKAKTTLGTLRHIAGGYRDTGVTADLAARIDRASAGAIPRESLCPACKACEFAKQCRSS
jgi:hypothetical protein